MRLPWTKSKKEYIPKQLYFDHAAYCEGMTQHTLGKLLEDHPAADIFQRIEENAVYGKAFKRIMRELSAEIAKKDQRIADLEAEVISTNESLREYILNA